MGKELSNKLTDSIKIAGEFVPLYGFYQRGQNEEKGLLSKDRTPIRYKMGEIIQITIAFSIIYIPFTIMLLEAISNSQNQR
ncbi:MAG: hypothetical protein AABW51_02875 [Nanoarchaeota archaeon]